MKFPQHFCPLAAANYIVSFFFDGRLSAKTCVFFRVEFFDFEILVLGAQTAVWDVQTHF